MTQTQNTTKKTAKPQAAVEKIRISIFRSNFAIYAEAIDDSNGVTIAAASSKEVAEKGKKSEIAFKTGEVLAKKLSGTKIAKISFDRNGYKYHGRVKALADGARAGGLKF